MVFRLASMTSPTKQASKFHSKTQREVPKGHVAVYIGNDNEERKRFVVPLTCLNYPAFRELLDRVEEEYGFNHSMGGLTIPCNEETFINVCNLSSTVLVR